jgi:type IV secretory pathway VirJ component
VFGASRLLKVFFLGLLLCFALLFPVHTPALPPEVQDLPLLEFPAASPTGLLAVFLSGDGGWADLDRQVSGRLVAAGLPVIGWNCLKYFWTERTPEEAAHDLERTLEAYQKAWNKPQAVLIGYSRGADVLPFLASRLPPARQRQLRLIALLGASTTVRFEPLASDLLKIGPQAPQLSLRDEVEKLRGRRILAFYGAEEHDTLCAGMDSALAECVLLPGAHHFGGNYAEIADRILAELGL